MLWYEVYVKRYTLQPEFALIHIKLYLCAPCIRLLNYNTAYFCYLNPLSTMKYTVDKQEK